MNGRNENVREDRHPVGDAEVLDMTWRIPDLLWARIRRVLAIYDPRQEAIPDLTNQRLVIDALIYCVKNDCQWNQLPPEFGCGASVYQTYRRWEKMGMIAILESLLVMECEELSGMDWQRQMASSRLGELHTAENLILQAE